MNRRELVKLGAALVAVPGGQRRRPVSTISAASQELLRLRRVSNGCSTGLRLKLACGLARLLDSERPMLKESA
jgi:hypothetical protein